MKINNRIEENLCKTILSFSMVLCTIAVLAQGKAIQNLAKFDSTYIKTYPEQVSTRIYFSQKYTNLELENREAETLLVYDPNTTLNLGVGATLNAFTLNLAYGFDFLNPDEGKGKTKYLDLQTRVYSRKLVIDFFGQFYKGLYLNNTKDIDEDYPDPYYVRPDLYEQIFGLTAFYVFNNNKFTYRAPFVQNERQLKSAGSFLAGLEGYYGLVQGDSAIVPSFMDAEDVRDIQSVTRISFLRLGPSFGYAYSLVINQGFFATASLTFNLGYGRSTAHRPDEGTEVDNQLNIGAFLRFGIGYNSDKWYLGLTTLNNQVSTSSTDRTLSANFGIGNIRLNYVWRFNMGPKLKDIVDRIP